MKLKTNQINNTEDSPQLSNNTTAQIKDNTHSKTKIKLS